MDYLWTPWRYAYVTKADEMVRPGVPARLAAWQGDTECVFCNMIASVDYAIAAGMTLVNQSTITGSIQLNTAGGLNGR